MSYSNMYLVYKTTVRNFAEYSNSWGSLPPLWKMISQNTGVQNPIMLYSYDDESNKLFFNLWQRNSMPMSHRICFLLTMDGALIELDKLEDASNHFKEVHADILKCGSCDWSHFLAMGEDLKKLSKTKIDKRCIGVSINWTSVSDIWLDEKCRKPVFYVYDKIYKL